MNIIILSYLISVPILWFIYFGFANANMRQFQKDLEKQYPLQYINNYEKSKNENEENWWFCFGLSFLIALLSLIGIIVMLVITTGFKYGWTIRKF